MGCGVDIVIRAVPFLSESFKCGFPLREGLVVLKGHFSFIHYANFNLVRKLQLPLAQAAKSLFQEGTTRIEPALKLISIPQKLEGGGTTTYVSERWCPPHTQLKDFSQ
jgi:hypothetical protein